MFIIRKIVQTCFRKWFGVRVIIRVFHLFPYRLHSSVRDTFLSFPKSHTILYRMKLRIFQEKMLIYLKRSDSWKAKLSRYSLILLRCKRFLLQLLNINSNEILIMISYYRFFRIKKLHISSVVKIKSRLKSSTWV